MDRPDALTVLSCRDCGGEFDPDETVGPCPDCGGYLEARYDLDAVAPTIDAATPTDGRDFLARTGLAALLPGGRESDLDGGHGETPLVDVPALADDLGLASVAIKDEGCNPTGAIADREMATAVAGARDRGATDVALPTMGNAGQAAAAAAARAGLASHSFVPSRTPFVNKAMINVHGGDMTVVEGRYRDAREAFDEAMADADWATLAPFETPYRQEGTKPIAYEIAAARGWSAPDAVVVPTGQVTDLVGLYRGFRELVDLDVVDDHPRLVAAEAAGCAPLTSARDAGTHEPVAVDHPDTVCGQLEIPDSPGGNRALSAIDATGGVAVASGDDAILAAAAALAEAGGPASVTAGAGLAGVRTLVESGELGAENEIVIVNPVSANKEADLLRSHLMSTGR